MPAEALTKKASFNKEMTKRTEASDLMVGVPGAQLSLSKNPPL